MASVVLPPLLQAARDGNLEEVNTLLGSGVDVNQMGPGNTNALIFACGMGNKDVVVRLLGAGAHVNHKTMSGSTALIGAAGSSEFSKPDKQMKILGIIVRLLEKGANINEKTNDDKTALHAAASVGNALALSLLILRGGNANDKDTKGMTPLHHAVLRGRKDVVAKLIKTPRVNVRSMTLEGKTPKQLALEAGNREIINMLSEAWLGWSRSDMEQFEILNTPQFHNYSCCPICLAYAERSLDCMYMYHKCPNVGAYYNERLYNLFKDEHGVIQWCAICGRICKDHKHYSLAHSDIVSLPQLLEPGPLPADINEGADTRSEYPYTIFGDERGCKRYGGGGVLEKVARFRALREKALELSSSEPRTYYNAWIQMIEASWMAPLSAEEMEKARVILSRNVGSRRWNIPILRFPETSKPRVLPIISEEELWPLANTSDVWPIRQLATEEGQTFVNVISYDESKLVFQLRHLQRNNTVLIHDPISVESLFSALDAISVVGTEEFGRCVFHRDTGCDALMYPGELQHILRNTPAAGLGAITDEERENFQDTTHKYTERFRDQFSINIKFQERIEKDMKNVIQIKIKRKKEEEARMAAALRAAGGSGGGGLQGGARRTIRRRRVPNSRSKQTRHKRN